MQQYYAYISLMIAIFKSTIHQCLTNDPKCLHNIKVYMVTMHTYIVHVENSDTIIEKASINNKYFNFIPLITIELHPLQITKEAMNIQFRYK